MHVEILGVPMDLGAGQRGTALGPDELRRAGLKGALESLGNTVTDIGNIEVPARDAVAEGEPRLRYLDTIRGIARRVRDATAGATNRGRVPLVLGGDHSLSIGSIRGVAQHKRLGVLWIDAHGDFNTHESTPSGNIHGMPLSTLVGLGDERLIRLDGGPAPLIDPSNVVLFGVRDLDPGECELLDESAVSVFSMAEIRRLGITEAVARALEIVSRGTDGVYVSIDFDGMDPADAPGVSTPVQRGLTREESKQICSLLRASGRVAGVDLVELDPGQDDRGRTASLGVELATLLLGSASA
jgi:arginase